MQPIHRKLFADCPRCHSPAVRVPWEPRRVSQRRRVLNALAVLWVGALVWLVVSLLRGGSTWLLVFAPSAAVTAAAVIMVYRSARSYRCAACGLRWRI